MKNFKQTKSNFYKSFKYLNKTVDIWINPTKNELRDLFKESKYDFDVRAWVDKRGNVYVWDADKMIHATMKSNGLRDELGNGEVGYTIWPIYIVRKPKRIDISEFIVNTDQIAGAVEAIGKNRNLRKLLGEVPIISRYLDTDFDIDEDLRGLDANDIYNMINNDEEDDFF